MLPLLASGLFRLHERLLGRKTFSLARQLERSQWWSPQELERFRLARLREMVRHCWQQTPYWRSVMDAGGIGPEDIRSLADLARFPLLEKETIRRHRDQMLWRGTRRGLRMVRTSGSTNEALEFYTCADREAHINAARIRGHRWVGVNKGHKEMYFWGSPVELSKQDRVKRVRDWLINDGLTDGFELTAERVARYIDTWKRWRPRCLFGYPSSFVLMVMMAHAKGIDLGGLAGRGLRAICTTSEILSDVDRQMIAVTFGVPVYDSYGIREGGLIGHECEHQTMHCVDEQLILETIDPDTLEPTDGEGELVLTNLVSKVMPIIRYRTGDIVTLSERPCPCGRSLTRVEITGGRAVDFVVTSDDRWIAGYAFIYVCRSVPGIVKFQVRQERKGRIRLLLATNGDFPSNGAQRVRDAVCRRLRSDDEVCVERVGDIHPSPSGKYRPVISEVAAEYRKRSLRRQGKAPASVARGGSLCAPGTDQPRQPLGKLS